MVPVYGNIIQGHFRKLLKANSVLSLYPVFIGTGMEPSRIIRGAHSRGRSKLSPCAGKTKISL
jgi:hypothetical protein